MKNGGFAFPVLDTTAANDVNSLVCVEGGMTLRDYFAGQALVGCVGPGGLGRNPSRLAKEAYLVADAMLAERVKEASGG